MMKQRCKTLPARVLAVVLSLVMLLGSLPVSSGEPVSFFPGGERK